MCICVFVCLCPCTVWLSSWKKTHTHTQDNRDHVNVLKGTWPIAESNNSNITSNKQVGIDEKILWEASIDKHFFVGSIIVSAYKLFD